VLAGDLGETDRQFSQVRAGIRKAFVGIATMRPSLLSPESRMHAGEADIAKKHHWNRVTEATRFEHGRSCASPRSRHLCILHIRVRKVEGEIGTGIFGIRFVPRPGIIF
jgi:hypothetical protein